MRLKIATTATMIVGMVLMACWPFILGPRPPKEASKLLLQEYARRSAIYFCLLLIIFFIAILFAWFSLRQTRREFQAQARENMQKLIEGALQDHADRQP